MDERERHFTRAKRQPPGRRAWAPVIFLERPPGEHSHKAKRAPRVDGVGAGIPDGRRFGLNDKKRRKRPQELGET